MWRNYQKKREERKGVACYFKTGTADAGRASPRKDYVICLLDQGGERMDVHENKSGTLLAHGRSNPPIIMATSQGNAEIGIGYCPPITAAAGMAGNNQQILFHNHGPDTRYTGPVEVAQTITSALGTGGNNTPLAVNKEPFCIAGNIINRKEKNGGNGCGYQQGISYTLTTEDRHCVFAPENERKPYQEVIGSLCAGDEKMISNQYVDQGKCIVDMSSLVRRLIPLECERLMGFPDYWTDIPGASDSARYRALGNSLAVPCVDFILCGITYFLRKMGEEEEDVFFFCFFVCLGYLVAVEFFGLSHCRNHYFILCVCVCLCRGVVSASHCRSLCLSDHTGGGYDHYGFYPVCLCLFFHGSAAI